MTNQKAGGRTAEAELGPDSPPLERGVERGLQRLKTEVMGRIGVDEKALQEGHGHMMPVDDLGQGRVLYTTQERKNGSGWVLENIDAGTDGGHRGVGWICGTPRLHQCGSTFRRRRGKIVFNE